jgi:hypothetical protein
MPSSPRRWAATASGSRSPTTSSGHPSRVAKTCEGVPALLEFITEKAEDFSMFA